MLNKILSHFGYHRVSTDLARLLVNPGLREDFLGVKEVVMPTPERIIQDSNKLANFASSEEYQVFAKEVWARSLTHLDLILDAGTTGEKLQYHRGALRASLDLLRLSYQARSTRELMEKDMQERASTSPFRS